MSAPARDSWPIVVVMVGCLTVIAVDHQDIPVGHPFWWPFLYGTAAVTLFVWRVSHWRPMLSVFGAFLFSASVARGVAFLAIANRNYAAAAIHGLMAMFTFGFVRGRSGEGRRS